ncbi:7-carboxy-7-deazaguanine synthase QueE [Actinomadura sp. KC06]|nr:7-carboxy-7-deazaguanine synthase QueE [Actinomadura sp. KC06]
MNETARHSHSLWVSERFGPTFQGEGPSAGRQAVFVRLLSCNLDCGRGEGAAWSCDTPYTWDWDRFDRKAEGRRVPVRDLVSWILDRRVELMVITGGEPLLQQRRLVDLVVQVLAEGRRVEIETNGTVVPLSDLCRANVTFNVSPKLSASGVATSRRVVDEPLRVFGRLARAGGAVFKFVVTCQAELDEVARLVDAHALAPVWIMPAGTDADVVLRRARELAEPVLARGWHLTPRLHTLLWGDARGR